MIDKLAWIHIQDKHILPAKSFGKDKYYIPGGKENPVKQMLLPCTGK